MSYVEKVSYFKNTPENRAAFLKKFPDAFESASATFGQHPDAGEYFLSPRNIVSYSKSIGYGTRQGYEELDLSEPASVAKKFPKKRFFKCTPENIAAFRKEFPNARTTGCNPDEFFERRKSDQVAMSTGDDFLDWNSDNGFAEKNGYTEYVFEKPEEKKSFPVNHYFVFTPENMESFEREFPFEGGYVTAKYSPTVSINHSDLVKEDDMNKNEMQEIANMVVEQLKPAKPEGPGITGKAASLTWRATKGTAKYCFAPAAPWVQNIVFLIVASGIGYGTFKSYNWAKNTIQMPKIVWEEPSSPSDHPFK